MNNTLIQASIDEVLSGKSSRIIIDSTLKEGLTEVLKSLIARNLHSLDITYFSSRGEDIYDVQDHITYQTVSGLLNVDHQPKDSNHKTTQEIFNVNIEKYIARMKFMDSITFIEMDYSINSKVPHPNGQITFNVFQKMESPMTKVMVSSGKYHTHYITIASAKLKLMIDLQPTE
jgi:hypothetical protein